MNVFQLVYSPWANIITKTLSCSFIFTFKGEVRNSCINQIIDTFYSTEQVLLHPHPVLDFKKRSIGVIQIRTLVAVANRLKTWGQQPQLCVAVCWMGHFLFKIQLHNVSLICHQLSENMGRNSHVSSYTYKLTKYSTYHHDMDSSLSSKGHDGQLPLSLYSAINARKVAVYKFFRLLDS